MTLAPKSRDPWLWPFAAESIWNAPIGSGAVYSKEIPGWRWPAKRERAHDELKADGTGAPRRRHQRALQGAPRTWAWRRGRLEAPGRVKVADLLHLARKGYETLADAIEPVMKEMCR